MKPSPLVAEALARVWDWHRTPQFLDYVVKSSGVRVTDLAAFDGLYIYQVAEGDVETGSFHRASTFQWWVMDDAGMRECVLPRFLVGWVDAPEMVRDSFYRWPHITFVHLGDQVGFTERYGPKLLTRKAGRVVESDRGVEIVDVRVVHQSAHPPVPEPVASQSVSQPCRRFRGGGVVKLFNWLFGLKPITFEGGSGETLETAVVIRGTRSSARGVPAEYRYLEQRFGRPCVDWRLVEQSLVVGSDGKHYDLFRLALKDEREVEVYFDISEFHGRVL
jgi:hypothetical protein